MTSQFPKTCFENRNDTPPKPMNLYFAERGMVVAPKLRPLIGKVVVVWLVWCVVRAPKSQPNGWNSLWKEALPKRANFQRHMSVSTTDDYCLRSCKVGRRWTTRSCWLASYCEKYMNMCRKFWLPARPKWYGSINEVTYNHESVPTTLLNSLCLTLFKPSR